MPHRPITTRHASSRAGGGFRESEPDAVGLSAFAVLAMLCMATCQPLVASGELVECRTVVRLLRDSGLLVPLTRECLPEAVVPRAERRWSELATGLPGRCGDRLFRSPAAAEVSRLGPGDRLDLPPPAA